MSKSSTETVKVMVRVRPMNTKEINRGKFKYLKSAQGVNHVCKWTQRTFKSR